jgi:DNA polymerase phi
VACFSLTKGIYSSHKAAREGFCLALTRLLATMPKIGSEDVLAKLRETGSLSAKLKGQEQRDALLGRLFGYLAIMRSGRFASSQVKSCVRSALSWCCFR